MKRSEANVDIRFDFLIKKNKKIEIKNNFFKKIICNIYIC